MRSSRACNLAAQGGDNSKNNKTEQVVAQQMSQDIVLESQQVLIRSRSCSSQ